jgi:metal-responsive CopG/Arc/MetJ family transcriptional regulator
MQRHIHRTTITLPGDLLEAMDRSIRSGVASNRNEFIVMAIEAEIRRQRRAAIDADLARMASDSELQAEHRVIMKDFDGADREAWDMLPTDHEAR